MATRVGHHPPVGAIENVPQPANRNRYSLLFFAVGAVSVITAVCQGVLFNPACMAWNSEMDQREQDLKSCLFRVQLYESAFKAQAYVHCKDEVDRQGIRCLPQEIFEFCSDFSKDKIPFAWRSDVNQCDRTSRLYFQKGPRAPLSCYAKRAVEGQAECQEVDKRLMQRWMDGPLLCPWKKWWLS
jgi:hypothetical protein